MKIKKTKLEILGEFAGHLLMGAVMFMVLFIVGGTLGAFVHWVAPFFDVDFVNLMKFVEKCILYSDVVFITWWTIYSTYKAAKEL